MRTGILALILAVSAGAQVNFQPRIAATNSLSGGGGGGGSCSTARDSLAGDNSSTRPYGNGGELKIAFKFTAGASYSLCKTSIKLRKVGTPAQNCSVEVWSHNSGTDLPSALVGSAATSRAASTFQTTLTDEEFTWSSAPSLTSGTVYWLAVTADSSSNSNYPETGTQNGGPSVRVGSWDGATWTYWADRAPYFTLYSN